MTAVHSQHKTLTELLDLSLKTPEVGAVNFNILHQLLAQVLQHVGLAEKTAVLNNDTNLQQNKGPSTNDLYKKVHNMEERLKVLNSFPTPKEIIEKSQGESVQNAAVSTFQSIQLKKSVEANEEGVAKSLGLIDEILDEMNDLKKSNEEMKQKLDDSVEKLSSELNELKETSMKMEEQLDKKGKHLDKVTEFLEELPKLEEFDQFVTFPVVAQALVTGTLDENTFKESKSKPTAKTEKRKVSKEKKKAKNYPANPKIKVSIESVGTTKVTTTRVLKEAEPQSVRAARYKEIVNRSTERESSEEREIREKIRALKKAPKKTVAVNLESKFRSAEVNDEKNTLASSSPSIREYEIDESSNFQDIIKSKKDDSKYKRKRSSLSSLSSLRQRRVSSDLSIYTDDLRSRSGFTLAGKKGSAMSLVEARVKNPTGTHALEKLGRVFSRIDQLEEKIKRYENETSDKADKKDFEQVKRIVMEQINHRTRGASISFQDQIDNLSEQINQLAGTRDNMVYGGAGGVGGAIDLGGKRLEKVLGVGLPSIPVDCNGYNTNTNITKLSEELVRLDQACKLLGKKLSVHFKEIQDCSNRLDDKSIHFQKEIDRINSVLRCVKKITDKLGSGQFAHMLEIFGINISDDNSFKGYGTEMHDNLDGTDVQNQVFHSNNIPVATKIAIHRKVLETNALTSLQNSITAVESKIKSLSQDMTSIADENRNYEKKLDKLCSSFETLNKEKANDEGIKKLINSKVDKAQLVLKVDQKDFENKLHEIADKFMEVMQRMNNSGDDWREMVKKLSDEIETKLGRDELDQIKKELEKRLGKLRKMVDEAQGRLGSKMQGDILMEGDEAAGLRRQLINYNCISCNRPIDVKHPFTPSYAYPSIPSGGEFPYNRTTRPYTTFELDQIRNHAKGTELEELIKGQATNYKLAVEEREYLRLRQIEEMARQINFTQTAAKHISFQDDELDSSHNGRACGGNYTMSYPHKGPRYTRLTHISELWMQDDLQNQMKSDNKEVRPPAEVDLLGENGQIYKGRLPGLKEKASQNMQQPQTANQSERPNSSINTRPRPKSAVPLSRRRRTINLRGLNERLIESKSTEQ